MKELTKKQLEMINDYKITDIQFFDYVEKLQLDEYGIEEGIRYSYSANVVINDRFLVQVWGKHNLDGSSDCCGFDGITHPDDAFWGSEEQQLAAREEIDSDDLEAILEYNGFENNVYWLSENATDIMLSENKQYRP